MILTWPYLVEKYGVARARSIMQVELLHPSSELHIALFREYDSKRNEPEMKGVTFKDYLNARVEQFKE